jgi:hypothetical protein
MKKLFLLLLLVVNCAFGQTFPVNNLQINGTVSGNVSGTGNVALINSPTFLSPALGIPSAVTLTNGTGLPISTGLVGLGSGVATGLSNAVSGTGGGMVLSTNPTISQLNATSEGITYSGYTIGSRAPFFIWQNPSNTNSAGVNAGQQIWIGNNPTATPGAGDTVAETVGVANGNFRNDLWATNFLVGLCGPAEGCTTGDYTNGTVQGSEIDVFGSASYLPANRAFNATSGTFVINGQEVYCQGPQYCTSAYSAWSTATNGSNWWQEGAVYNRVAQIGVHFVVTPGDTGQSFQSAAIQDDSNSVNVIDVGSGSHSFYLLAPNLKLVSNGLVIPGSYNVGTLPTCSAGTQGAIAYVHDAVSPTYNAVLTGGGGTAVLAFCNGSSWTAH